jgi:hypothetical protein
MVVGERPRVVLISWALPQTLVHSALFRYATGKLVTKRQLLTE